MTMRLADIDRQVIERVRLLGCLAITRVSSGCPEWFPEGGILIVDIAESEAQLHGHDLGRNAIIVSVASSCRILYDTSDRERLGGTSTGQCREPS